MVSNIWRRESSFYADANWDYIIDTHKSTSRVLYKLGNATID
jgi:hypothetical protein